MFSFTFSCTEYFQHIFSLSHRYPCCIQDSFCFPILWFCKKKKKRHFCLFKIATQNVSLWHFHIYICIITQVGSSSIFLVSTLVPFLG
jgi:hypothetical protein